LNDIVSYGSNTYRSKTTQSNVLPTVTSEWELLTTGFSYQGIWSSATSYLIGQVIKYGGSLFQAISDNDNVNPTVTTTWTKLVPGYDTKGDWVTATEYGIDEVVVYGGNTYISLLPHASTVFSTDLAANKWLKFNSGIKWRGAWTTATEYLPDDVITDGVNTWISNSAFTSGSSISADVLEPNTGFKWSRFASGASGVPTVTSAVDGQFLSNNGSSSVWADAVPTNVTVTSSTNILNNNRYLCDTTAGGFTLTLPIAPSENDTIYIIDISGTSANSNITIDRNSSQILGEDEDLLLDVAYISIALLYTTTNKWRII